MNVDIPQTITGIPSPFYTRSLIRSRYVDLLLPVVARYRFTFTLPLRYADLRFYRICGVGVLILHALLLRVASLFDAFICFLCVDYVLVRLPTTG